MSEFSLTPEQAAALQAKGVLDPRVAAMAQRPMARPVIQGAPMSAQAGNLAAYMLAPGQMAPAPQRPAGPPQPSADAMRLRALGQQMRQPTLDDAIRASLAAKAQRVGSGAPVNGQMPLKAADMPGLGDGSGRAILGWDPAEFDDDEFLMAVKFVERNLDRMPPEAQQRAFGAFASVVAERPQLRAKLAAMDKEGRKK